MSKFVDFSWFHFCLNIEFEYYEEHTSRIEKMHAEEVSNLRKRIEKESEKLEGIEKAEHFESYGREFEYLYRIIPTIQRSSELVSVYSLLERNFLKVCEKFEERSDNPVKIRDLKSEGYINQAKMYLEKVVRIDFPEKGSVWQEILALQNIRNSFVHSNGKIKTGNNKLMQYIQESEYLELNNNDGVYIKEGFTNHCLDIFKEFFNIIFSLLEITYNSKLRVVE